MRPLPQWSAVGLQEPQKAVQVRMVGDRGGVDVTLSAVVAALRPLTLAVGMSDELENTIGDRESPQLHFIDLDSQRTVGILHLQRVRLWSTSGLALGLFEVRLGTHRCVRWPRRPWNRWLQARAMRRNKDPYNFSMPPEAAEQLMIFYICPRPVVLVSVDDGKHSNLFPMDLIGPVSPDRFTLALRSTSQSIGTMKTARRVALSNLTARDRQLAYKLGVHHKNVQVSWDSLPFKIQRSQTFSLRCPASAPRVRELEILDFDTIGSHTFFVARIASDHGAGEEDRLFHTSGIYQYFRSRNGRPFAAAP